MRVVPGRVIFDYAHLFWHHQVTGLTLRALSSNMRDLHGWFYRSFLVNPQSKAKSHICRDANYAILYNKVFGMNYITFAYS